MPDCSVPGCGNSLGEWGTWCKSHLEELHPETFEEVYGDA